jgi:ABC-type xylose transport system permease subunit
VLAARRSKDQVAIMKIAALTFGYIGIASGVIFLLGPLLFGTPGPSPGFIIAPVTVGLLVAVTHWRNTRRLRDSVPGRRAGLLAANLLLLALFVIGFLYVLNRYAGSPRLTYVLVAFALLWILPLGINAGYLLIASRHSEMP